MIKTLTPTEFAEIERLLPRWIPVAERLPEADTYVLAWNAEMGEVELAKVDAVDGFFSRDCPGAKQGDFTHWQPLPEPPEKV